MHGDGTHRWGGMSNDAGRSAKMMFSRFYLAPCLWLVGAAVGAADKVLYPSLFSHFSWQVFLGIMGSLQLQRLLRLRKEQSQPYQLKGSGGARQREAVPRARPLQSRPRVRAGRRARGRKNRAIRPARATTVML